MPPGRRVVLLSEHSLVREGLGALLRAHGWNVTELATTAIRNRSELVIVDLDHVGGDCQTVLRQIRKQAAGAYLVALASAARIAGCLEDHADSWVETPRATAKALLAAAARRPVAASPERARLRRQWTRVTPRQRDVLRWLAAGLDNPTIATRLRVSERAVKAHVSSLLDHFGLDNRTQLALLALRAGLRPPDGR